MTAPLEQSAASFANYLFAGPWSAPEIERHEGYSRHHFKLLLDRPTPPPALPGNQWRSLERLTWQFWRAFNALRAQQARLGEKSTDFTAAVNVDRQAKISIEDFTNPADLEVGP